MASAEQLTRVDFVIVDGTVLVTEVLRDSEDVYPFISTILNDMIEREDVVVGLDITWSPSNSSDTLLAICTGKACVLVTTESGCCSYELEQPRLRALGVRRLAYEVLSYPFIMKPRSSRIALGCSSAPENMTPEEIECVTIDAYAAYMIRRSSEKSI
ncbi:hypothetical protein F3Y22_tig00113279pilonHSYRG00075 [Hibiscus syriacus]|uniref:Uncharacterized protein n=1 Tax=Hibiscus syriacus TaxID=106335 RepID=A0A6A2Y348_HIBSY|nr:hypothetical protein F3Y22_tig00113279pilonHSYRG00075 [Hibiscus syriacus]